MFKKLEKPRLYSNQFSGSSQSTRKGLQFSPLEYMRIMSKQLFSGIGD